MPPGGDVQALALLAERCRSAGDGAPVAVSGFAGLLARRPGRDVHAWLAWASDGRLAACPLGFSALIVAGHRFSIGGLLVHPDARRRGVGTALVDHAVAEAAALGADAVHVETLATWPAAVRFWERMTARMTGPPGPSETRVR